MRLGSTLLGADLYIISRWKLLKQVLAWLRTWHIEANAEVVKKASMRVFLCVLRGGCGRDFDLTSLFT